MKNIFAIILFAALLAGCKKEEPIKEEAVCEKSCGKIIELLTDSWIYENITTTNYKMRVVNDCTSDSVYVNVPQELFLSHAGDLVEGSYFYYNVNENDHICFSVGEGTWYDWSQDGMEHDAAEGW